MERPWVGHKAYDGELVRLWKSADAGNPDGVKQAHSTLQSSAPSPHMAGFGKWRALMDEWDPPEGRLRNQVEVATKAGTLDIDNPLLNHIWLPWARHVLQLRDSSDLHMHNSHYASALRQLASAEYSWAIPTNEALSTILSFGRNIVELGSGHGYWASLLAAAGGNVTAVEQGFARYYDDRYFPQTVNQDGAAYLQEHEGVPDATLFLCWGHQSDFDEALAAFRGEYLAVVGEGASGCTWWPEWDKWDVVDSDDGANQAQRQWRLIRTIVIPKWEGIHDYLVILQRDEANEASQKQERTAGVMGKIEDDELN